MLGRLEMHVDECIDAYTGMFKRIFGKKRLPVNILGKIKGRFDSMVLEECVKEILEEGGLPTIEPFNDEKDGTCKVSVVLDILELWLKFSLTSLQGGLCESCRDHEHNPIAILQVTRRSQQYSSYNLRSSSSNICCNKLLQSNHNRSTRAEIRRCRLGCKQSC